MSEKVLLNKIKKHLKGHIKEGNFDNLDIAQIKLIDKELKRIMPPKKKVGGEVKKNPYNYGSTAWGKFDREQRQESAREFNAKQFGKGVKGSKSKTHKGDLDYTTKKGDKVFHEDGHIVRKTYKPFDAHKGSKSKTHAGLDYMKIPMKGGGVLKLKITHGGDSDSDSDSDMEGMGIIDDAKNMFNKAKDRATNIYHKVEDTVHKIRDVAHKVYTGDTGMPPNVKKILEKYGDQLITKISIIRNPVGKALTGALSIASMGEFGRNLENAPYDKLFHLKICCTLQDGTHVSLEKVERVNMVVNPKSVKNEEVIDTPLNGKQITLGELYENARNKMGGLFYPYSAKSNNCQNFILNVLQASGIGNQQDYEFVKQDTEHLFGENSFLRKASNTITDIGARFNVLQQGGEIYDDSFQEQITKNQLSTAIKNNEKIKLAQRGLYATNAIPITGGKLPKHKKLTFKDFAQGWARHHGITHGGALKSKQAKHHYKTINDHLIMEGKGWDDFIQGSKKFFTGGYNDQIKGAFENVGNKISQTTQQVKDKANKVISDINSGIKIGQDEIKSLINSAEIDATQKFELIKAFVKNASNKVKEGIMTGVNYIKKYGDIFVNWLKDHEEDMKQIAISVAKFAVSKGIPLVGEELGKVFGTMLSAGAFQPWMVPIAQTLGGMLGKKLGEMLADYLMSLGLADLQGNPDADKWLAITGQAIDAGKMAYSGYKGLQSVGNYLSGASSAGSAVAGATAVGVGFNDFHNQMKLFIKTSKQNGAKMPYKKIDAEMKKAQAYHNQAEVIRKRGRPRKIKNPFE
jgi:hypothetical protein